ncbi:TrkH family potassium uptake protein [Roseobacter sp. CCS2]|uniref:TrkH family potassium uptake protein n=1 Tax=Roseobacter sp. CCS2 TaxID=391593 RepID=UPI0000F4015B|nr:potassium transporter TrkG [Roseobacter sp. CCS2]EBA13607.1 K+ transporter Trk [Roseobacter sp. CCS2]
MFKSALQAVARTRTSLLRLAPAKMLLLGYLSYMIIGWALLAMPFAQEGVVSALDALFIATSAVSTTGLVTVDPGGSFSFAGELIILLLIQIGGLGYMTIGSFTVLAVQNKMSGLRTHAVKHAFNLPSDVRPAVFVRAVIVFTLLVEAVGAIALYFVFAGQGVENPVWMAIFHAVSAFCTAGFSLFSTSFEAFRADGALNIIIATLSLLGAMGFLIVVDTWRTLTGQARHLGFTSKVIVRITLWFLLIGTVLLALAEPTIATLPAEERWLAAFFQAMTASTTVGFNTHPIGALSAAVLIIMYFLMIFGASPAGTGGGLKTTAFAALVGLVRSTLKGRDRIRFFKREVPLVKLQAATAGLAFYMTLLLIAMFVLLLTETDAAFEVVMFEVISAMGTVGLSMGLTGDLSDIGKIVVIVLMTAGRVGILTFGIALAAHDESREEEEDNDLVL